MMDKILCNEDVDRLISMRDAIRQIERALTSKAEGKLIAPARFSVDVEKGSLVFTPGAEIGREHSMGFRVMQLIDVHNPDSTQIVASFDTETGSLNGIALGDRIERLRVGAIGGVAIDRMARSDVSSLAVIGSGRHAKSQLEAAVEVRDFERIAVFSPSEESRNDYAARMGEKLGVEIQAVSNSDDAVRGADVIICATSSDSPVFDPGLLEPGVHVNNVGPKFEGYHELDLKAVEKSTVIATDSLAQVDDYPRMGRPPFFLNGTPFREDMIELSEIVVGHRTGRSTEADITLFCSVGLAGTEVVVANEAFRRM